MVKNDRYIIEKKTTLIDICYIMPETCVTVFNLLHCFGVL